MIIVYSLDQGGLVVDGLPMSVFEWPAWAHKRWFHVRRLVPRPRKQYQCGCGRIHAYGDRCGP